MVGRKDVTCGGEKGAEGNGVSSLWPPEQWDRQAPVSHLYFRWPVNSAAPLESSLARGVDLGIQSGHLLASAAQGDPCPAG